MDKPTPSQVKAIAELAKLLSKPSKSMAWQKRCEKAWDDVSAPYLAQVQRHTDLVDYWYESQLNIRNRHIKRLQDQCRLLSEVLCEERALRKKAWLWKTLRTHSSTREATVKLAWSLFCKFKETAKFVATIPFRQIPKK